MCLYVCIHVSMSVLKELEEFHCKKCKRSFLLSKSLDLYRESIHKLYKMQEGDNVSQVRNSANPCYVILNKPSERPQDLIGSLWKKSKGLRDWLVSIHQITQYLDSVLNKQKGPWTKDKYNVSWETVY